MALNATFNAIGLPFGFFTIIVGHATFCVVVVYNNVIARLRRSSASIEEASMDLGADTWQTFRLRDVARHPDRAPRGRPARVRAVVRRGHRDDLHRRDATQTLPIWILANLRLPNQRPLVNVVAVTLIVLSAIPVYLSTRLSSDAGAPGRRA